MYSNVTLVGNLARDPESRQVGEYNVTRLVVAVNDSRQKDKVSYVDVEAWGKLGEICQKYLTKGRQVLTNGRIVQDTWEKDGKKNSKLYVKADNVQFLGGKGGGDSEDGPSNSNTSESAAADEDIPF